MGQVGLGQGDFLTQSTMVGQKKSNPTHMGRVTRGLDKFFYYYKYKYIKKTQR